MRIGRLAKASGVSVDTLRFYERQGLIREPLRSVGGYREYSSDAIETIRFRKETKALGFTLAEIRDLLSMGVRCTGECGPLAEKAERKLAEMKREIRRLRSIQTTLEKMIRHCAGQCGTNGAVKSTVDSAPRRIS
jgi:DNA-binding transcriptional MerR regulator